MALSARLFTSFSQGKSPTFPKNQQIEFEATVGREPKISDKNQVIEVADAKIYTDLYPKYHVGDRLLVSGKVSDDGQMFGAKVQKVGQRGGLAAFRSKLRAKIASNIASILPEREATLVLGTVLGVDTISRNFKDELVKTGTIHVVVVSGQNLMIVAGVFMGLGRFVGRRKSLLLSLSAVFAYAFLTGFEPPVVRAFLMVLATTVAVYTGREAMPFWSLFLAAILIIFISPQAIFEVSFQLTFAATLGIVTLGAAMQRSFKRFGFLGQNAAVATSAYFFTAPIILYYFGQVSPLAPLTNILVVEVVFPVMVLGFLVAIFSLIFMPAAQVLAYLAFVPAFYFVKVVELFAKIPVGQMSLGKGNFIFVATFYILVFILILIWRRGR